MCLYFMIITRIMIIIIIKNLFYINLYEYLHVKIANIFNKSKYIYIIL